MTTSSARAYGAELLGSLLLLATVVGSDLMTTDAEAYFERFGFVGVDRGDLPPELAGSVAMVRRLD